MRGESDRNSSMTVTLNLRFDAKRRLSMRRTSKVLFLFVSTLALSALIASFALPASAQSLEWLNAPVKVPARITVTPDDSVLTTLKGNLHPLAIAKYDRGVVSDSLPMR